MWIYINIFTYYNYHFKLAIPYSCEKQAISYLEIARSNLDKGFFYALL